MEIKHNKATIYIYGRPNKEIIEEATIAFMRKVMKERIQNGDNNTSGTIKEKPLLVK